MNILTLDNKISKFLKEDDGGNVIFSGDFLISYPIYEKLIEDDYNMFIEYSHFMHHLKIDQESVFDMRKSKSVLDKDDALLLSRTISICGYFMENRFEKPSLICKKIPINEELQGRSSYFYFNRRDDDLIKISIEELSKMKIWFKSRDYDIIIKAFSIEEDDLRKYDNNTFFIDFNKLNFYDELIKIRNEYDEAYEEHLYILFDDYFKIDIKGIYHHDNVILSYGNYMGTRELKRRICNSIK